MTEYISSIKEFFSYKSQTNEGHKIVGICDALVKKTINANTNQVVI